MRQNEYLWSKGLIGVSVGAKQSFYMVTLRRSSTNCGARVPAEFSHAITYKEKHYDTGKQIHIETFTVGQVSFSIDSLITPIFRTIVVD